MKTYNKFFVFFTCFLLLFLSFTKNDSQAACGTDPSVNIKDHAYTPTDPTSIQEAYDYASADLGMTSFTLQLAEGIFTGDLILNGWAVVIDGGYDCTFSTQNSTSSIFGKVTISTGSLNFTAETKGF